MMQVPSSNHSTCTSRRSNTSRKTTLASWFDGFIDKACCAAAGYAAGCEVDDNSIAYSETDTNENSFSGGINRSRNQSRDDSSVVWDAADDSVQWVLDGRVGVCSYDYRNDKARPSTIPPSPRSDATATTVLTGSSSSTRGISPKTPSTPACKASERAHSTGNIRRPEDEWQQQNALQRRANTKAQLKKSCPREVLVPIDWQHEHGMRRTHSETLPKLPFPTIQPAQRAYHRCHI